MGVAAAAGAVAEPLRPGAAPAAVGIGWRPEIDLTVERLPGVVANLHTNAVNLGLDPLAALADLPLEAVAYVHVAGGTLRDGVWHDTHAHPVPPAVLDLLGELCARVPVPGVLLERDDAYPTDAALAAHLGHRAGRSGRWRTASRS